MLSGQKEGCGNGEQRISCLSAGTALEGQSRLFSMFQ